MSDIHYVVRQGRRIRVQTFDPTEKPPPKANAEAFALMPLGWMAAAAKAANAPIAMVLTVLIYQAWKTRSSTFPLSNELLRPYGVARWSKYRVLARLEKAGLIRIQRQHKKAPVITLLVKPKRGPRR